MCRAGGLPHRGRPTAPHRGDRRQPARRRRLPTCRPAADRAAPASSHRRQRARPTRGGAGGDRPAAPAPQRREHLDLRKSEHRRPSRARSPVARERPVSTLGREVDEYVAVRRALGSKFPREEQVLHSFVEFLEAEGASTITTVLAVRWATLSPEATRGHWDRRLSTARGFARHMSHGQPRTEVPPTGLLGSGGPSRRAEPYLYSPEKRSRPSSTQDALGPLAIRGGHLRDLARPAHGERHARRGGAGAQRRRPRRGPRPPRRAPQQVRAFTGGAVALDAVRTLPPTRPCVTHTRRAGVTELLRHPGREAPALRASMGETLRVCATGRAARRSPRCRPRMHDFRHAFACATLEDWYRQGRTCRRSCRCCRPTSAMSTRHPRTGTCRASRSCSPWRQTGWRPLSRCCRDHARASPPGLLHRAAHGPAGGEPAHGRLLPRRVPFAAHLCRGVRRKSPSRLELTDLDAPLVGAFLEHLEKDRGNSVRTRNSRLVAVHSLFRFAALREPAAAAVVHACSPSPRRDSRRQSSRSSRSRRSRRSLGAPTGRLGRGGRPRPLAPHVPDGPAGLRGGHTLLRGRDARKRAARALPRQGAQGARHSAHLQTVAALPRVDRGAAGRAGEPPVPEPPARPARPGRGREAGRQVRPGRRRAPPVVAGQGGLAARPPPLDRDGLARPGRRHRSDRALARPTSSCGRRIPTCMPTWRSSSEPSTG